jgi:hypothetical protein
MRGRVFREHADAARLHLRRRLTLSCAPQVTKAQKVPRETKGTSWSDKSRSEITSKNQ